MNPTQAWAERVLTGSTLDDKLAPPPAWSRDSWGGRGHPSRNALPATPGRPAALGFPTQSPKVPFPKDLATDAARGTVLHFFANHELLALELMALAILRFGDTPPMFHHGLVGVMRDEQTHLRGYLARMEACGVPLGAVPVNRYFWDALAGVHEPLAFISGLSLTFEQANLDFAVHYAAAFRQVGDTETATVLDTVLADEVRHVRHGLAWFDRWRTPDLSRWEAWVGALPPPLTPARAKGTVFARAPREAAGIDVDTIDRLAVYGASKGRPPRVYTFHPEVEADVLGAAPSPAASAVAADLAALMIVLAGQDDLVMLPRMPSLPWLAELQTAGFELPELIVGTPEHAPASLSGRTLGGLCPWGTSPRVAAMLAPLRDQLAPKAPDGAHWDARWPDLYDKGWAAALLRDLAAHDTFIDVSVVGVVCRSENDVTVAREAWSRHRCVAKAPWSTAGRGLRTLDAPDAPGWIRRVLREQGSVVLEPWLERVLDLSVQIDVRDEGIRVHPWGRFLCDPRGRYKGAIVGRVLEDVSPELRRAVAEAAPVLARTATAVGERLLAMGYRGPAGIDAMIYQDGEILRCKPLVEINPRVTMGRVAQALGKRVAPGCVGLIRQVGRSEVGAAGFVAWAEALRVRAPLRVETRGGAPMIVGGALFTTDPSLADALLGVLVVAPSRAEAEALLHG